MQESDQKEHWNISNAQNASTLGLKVTNRIKKSVDLAWLAKAQSQASTQS